MRITVIGEICEDVFYYGDVNRICPEAPVPVFVPKKYTKNSGMSGNLANNIRSLLNDSDVRIIHQSNKITKTRYVDEKSNQMIMRLDEGDESTGLISLDINLIKMIQDSDLVAVTDYNKGFFSPKELVQIAKLSKISILDTKSIITKGIIENFNFIKVNENEYQYNKKIIDKYPDKVIITMGKQGAKYMGKIYPSPSPKETIDVSGAGDTFCGAFIVKYFETNDIEKSIIFANEMASLVVSKRGIVVPHLSKNNEN